MIRELDSGNATDFVDVADIIANSKSYLEIANTVSTSYSEAVRRGTMSDDDRDILDFYTELAAVASATVETYAMDG